jgi:aminoglycoside 2'-N-acetyltransferase I
MYPTEELSADARAEVVALCNAAHETEDFWKLFAVYIPSGGRHFLGRRGRELVSHAVVTTRWAQPAGHDPLKTAYVDAVATLPARQGRGWGTAVMRALGAGVDDYEIACLQTDKVGFYDRLGWEVWRGELAGRGDTGLIPTPDQQGVMVLRLPQTPALDLDGQLSIEAQPDRIWE